MGIIAFLLALPFEVLRSYVISPVLKKTQPAYDDYKERTRQGVISARELVIKSSILALAAAVIIWMAVFMYIAFYYTYMPAIAHIRPVHMQFKACEDQMGPCSFPQAHVLLTRKQQLLMIGQPYRISVNIDMPESDQNQQLGMFMVCAEMRDQGTQLRNHACRSAMLHYRSYLARTITTLVMSPLIVLGFREETQHIPVEIFSSYEDDQENPVTDVFVEIQSKHIQFYSVTLHITAHFSGLRYIMFHWPILSGTIGIGANLFFILTVSLLSWYHWSESVWIEGMQERDKNYEETGHKHEERPRSDRSELSSSKSSGDDEDISIIEEKSSQKSISDDSEDIEELSFTEASEERKRKKTPLDVLESSTS